MDLELVGALVLAVLLAAVGILRVVAKMTKTTKDDMWLARLEKVQEWLLRFLAGKDTADAVKSQKTSPEKMPPADGA